MTKPASTKTEVSTLPEMTPSAIIERRVIHTDTSLTIAQDTTFEEWSEIYKFYDHINERSKFYLGDAIKFAENKFPDRYTQSIELTGLSYSRLTTIVSVCGKIEPKRRRAELPFVAHEIIAYIPYQTGDRLLDECIKKRWTMDELRDAVAKSQGQPTRAEKAAARAAGVSTPKRGKKAQQQAPESNAGPSTIDVQAQVTPATETEVKSCAPNTENESKVHSSTSSTVPVPNVSASNAARSSDPTSAAEQRLMLDRAEASLNQFHEAITHVDWSLLGELAARRWFKMMVPSDNLIDVLMKKIPSAVRT